jgi:hypothetical protein
MQGNSRLVGSSKIEVEAKNKAVIRDDSSLVVGWEDAPVIPDERYKIYWDSKTGEVVDQFGELYPRKFKKSSLVASYLRGVYGAPEGTFSVININQPYNYKTIPHIHISANEAAVEDGVFDSRSGRNPSGLRIDSVDAIWLSGGSEINGFAQVELTADTVEMLKGVVYHSAIDVSAGDQNLAGVPGALIIRSGRLTDLRGQSLNGIVVVYSGDDIKVTDTNIGGYHEVNEASTTMLKLDAGGDLTIGTGELGISPYIEAYRVNLYGDNVHVKRTGIKSDMDVGIFGSNKIEIDGPTKINANLAGILAITIEAPEVYLNEGTSIEATAEITDWDGITGHIEINGKEILKLTGATLNLFSSQHNSERPTIELYGRQITLDNSKIAQFSYYNGITNFGEKYGEQHTNLSGRKLTLIEAKESVSLINDSDLYMNNGDIRINARDINIDDSLIKNLNIWPTASTPVSLIDLDAQRNITLTDSTIYGNTLSNFKRMKVNLEGLKLDSSNSLVGIFDERKGQSGTIDLDFGNSITLDRSQIVSIGEARVTTNTNGNYINVKSKDLTMNDSLIGGIVQRW